MRTRPDPLPAAPPACFQPAGGRLDAGSAPAFRSGFAAASRGVSALRVELSAISYLDWFGLEAVLDGVRSFPGPVTFAGVNLELRDYLRRNDVAGLLRIEPDAGPPHAG